MVKKSLPIVGYCQLLVFLQKGFPIEVGVGVFHGPLTVLTAAVRHNYTVGHPLRRDVLFCSKESAHHKSRLKI